MPFLTRVMNYYQKRGLIGTLRRICEQPYRIIFKNKMFLYYADMNELSDSIINLPQDIIIECKSTYNEAVQPEFQRIIDYWDKDKEIDKIRDRFEKGGILWIVKLNEDIAGFGWSIRGKMVSPWYLPLTPHDAVLFDFVTFEEYRGHSVYALFLDHILGKLRLEGVSRAFLFIWAWNTSSIRGNEKSCFVKFSEARKFHVFGRNITVWSQ